MHIIRLNKDKSSYNNLYPLTSVVVIRFFILGLSLNLPGIILLLGDPRRPGVILVNTAREGLVDRPALIDALNAGTIRSYCIDAFESEPPRERTLVSHPRVIATAHIGGFTRESVDLAAETAVDNLLGALAKG